MSDKPVSLRWRLRVMMAERDIRSVTELGRRLRRFGLVMSSQQLNRVVNEMPQRLNMDLLSALLAVLRCRPEDLIQIDLPAATPMPAVEPPASVQDAELPARRARAPRRRPATADPQEPVDDIAGPTVTPFPIVHRR